MAELTRGVLPQIVAGQTGITCVLQIVGIKRLNNSQQQPGSDRFRLLLSDGEFSYSAMLATQMSDIVLSGQVKEMSVIRLIDYLCNQMQEKKVLIVLNLEVLQAEASKIGNPQLYHENKAAAAAAGGGAGGAPPGPAAQNVAPNLQQQQQQQQYGGPAPAAPQFGGYGAAPSGPAGGGPGGNFGGGDQYGAPMAGGQAGPGGYGGGGMNQQPFNQGPGPGNPYGAPPSNPYGGGPGAAPGNPYGGGPGAAPGNPYGAGPPHGGAGGPPGNPYGAPQGGGGGAPGNPYGAPPANPYGPGPGSMYRGSGPVVKNEASNVMPINSLNSYQNRWTIKARVTAKSDIRRFSNQRGEGKFFTFDLLDADGGEIRVYGWNDACDKYVNSVEVGTVYMLSKASLRNKRGNFNQTRHPYEIHLERDSVVEPCGEDQSIPRIMFDFRPISELEDTPAGNMVDVIGVVESVNDWAMITKRDGGETQKRSLTIKDQSNRSIEVTLWGAYANNPGDELQQMVQGGHKPVLVVKGARVGDFNGKTLSTVGSSTIMVDPHDVEQAGTLRNWYDNGGGSMAAEALSNARAGGGRADRRIFLSQIKDEGLGMGAPAWVQVLATCSYVRDKNMYYAACPLQFNGKQCNKKMQDQGGGSWFCERCNQMAQPEWRYIVSITIDDHTGNTWATAFAESAPDLLGVTAGQLKEFEDNLDTHRFGHALQNAMFRPLTLKLKVNEDNWNDEQRIRVSVVRVEPTDLVKESRSMIDSIYKMQRGEPIMQAQGAFPQQQQQQQQGYGGGGVGGAGGPPRTPYGAGGAPQQQQQGYGGGYGGGQQQQGGWGGGQQGGGGGWNQNQNQQGGGGGGWQPQQQQQQGGWNQNQQGGGGAWNQGGNQGGGYGGGGGGW